MSAVADDAILEAKARALGISSGELVELAEQVFEAATDKEAEELRALIDQINRSVPETLRIADESHRRVDEVLGCAPSPVAAGT